MAEAVDHALIEQNAVGGNEIVDQGLIGVGKFGGAAGRQAALAWLSGGDCVDIVGHFPTQVWRGLSDAHRKIAMLGNAGEK